MSDVVAVFFIILLIILVIVTVKITNENDLIEGDLAKHITCKDLKGLMNSTHLHEQTISKNEYATRC